MVLMFSGIVSSDVSIIELIVINCKIPPVRLEKIPSARSATKSILAQLRLLLSPMDATNSVQASNKNPKRTKSRFASRKRVRT